MRRGHAHSSGARWGDDDQLRKVLPAHALLGQSLEVDVVLQTAIESAVEVLGLDMGVIYGGLEDCVSSAVAGRVVRDSELWSG